MVRYETLMLVRSESTAEDRAFLEKSMSALVAQHNGVFTSFDQWGKMKLAYPVEKENYGLYILVRYELSLKASAQFFKDLYMFFRIKTSEFLLRNINVRLEKDAPTTYLRPEPYDSTKAMTEAGSFAREGRDSRGPRAPRGDKPPFGDRPGRQFSSNGGTGKRFSHDHSSDDVMESITDEMSS